MFEKELRHSMTYSERAELKQFARKGKNLEQALAMIAHWMACNLDVTFSGYAANWAAARTHDDVSAMRKQWPLSAPRMIADNASEWGSALKTRA